MLFKSGIEGPIWTFTDEKPLPGHYERTIAIALDGQSPLPGTILSRKPPGIGTRRLGHDAEDRACRSFRIVIDGRCAVDGPFAIHHERITG